MAIWWLSLFISILINSVGIWICFPRDRSFFVIASIKHLAMSIKVGLHLSVITQLSPEHACTGSVNATETFKPPHQVTSLCCHCSKCCFAPPSPRCHRGKARGLGSPWGVFTWWHQQHWRQRHLNYLNQTSALLFTRLLVPVWKLICQKYVSS